MKKIYSILSVAVLLIGITSASAQKCKTEKDAFTGEKVVKADESNKYTNTRYIYLESRSGKIKLEVLWSYPGSLNLMVPKGSELLFKMKDGEVIKLTTIADAQPKLQAGFGGVYSGYVYELELEKIQLNKFAIGKIVALRVPDLKAGSNDIDKKSSQGTGGYYFKVINKGAKYLMKNM